MSNMTHKIHSYLILMIKCLMMIVVIGFLPIPLLSYFSGDILHLQDHNSLFNYFEQYHISMEKIKQNKFLNVYISQIKDKIQVFQIDNAAFWAEYVVHSLNQNHVSVVRKSISSNKQNYQQKKQQKNNNNQWSQTLMQAKQKIQLIAPFSQNFRQWVIIALNVNTKQIKKQVKKIISNNPHDNFLIISPTPLKINKRFSQIKFPQFDIKLASRFLSETMQINQIQAQIILIHFDKSLWKLKQANNGYSQFTLLTLLGQYYNKLTLLTKKQEKVLKKICQKGKAKYVDKVDLSDYGVLLINKKYQWANDLAILNYQIFKGVICGTTFISQLIKERFENPQFQNIQSKDQKSNQVLLNHQQKKLQNYYHKQFERNNITQNQIKQLQQLRLKKQKQLKQLKQIKQKQLKEQIVLIITDSEQKIVSQ